MRDPNQAIHQIGAAVRRCGGHLDNAFQGIGAARWILQGMVVHSTGHSVVVFKRGDTPGQGTRFTVEDYLRQLEKK